MAVKGFPMVERVEEVPVDSIPRPLRSKWAGLVNDLQMRLEQTSSKSALCYVFSDHKAADGFRSSALKFLNKGLNGSGRWASAAAIVGNSKHIYFYYQK